MHRTNGHLANIINTAAEDRNHPNHSEAATYITKFRDLEDTFFKTIHPYVDMGLAISEAKRADPEKSHVYTVHGCGHIADLIKSLDIFARSITNSKFDSLSVLEAYILLCAAHIHDGANISKREGHPSRCDELLKQHRDLFVSSVTQQIYDVARVHGGKDPIHQKDTFRSIEVDSTNQPRLLLLAALLRLGDELSENEARVPQAVVNSHPISEESKLAHAYAKSFSSFNLNMESLSIVYSVYLPVHQLFATINGKAVSFYGFLEDKIDMIEREALYCSQYARPAFNISEINITIRRYEGERPSALVTSETFTLHLNHGYPDLCHTLCQRSPELSNKKFNRLSDCFLDRPVGSINGRVDTYWCRFIRWVRRRCLA